MQNGVLLVPAELVELQKEPLRRCDSSKSAPLTPPGDGKEAAGEMTKQKEKNAAIR